MSLARDGRRFTSYLWRRIPQTPTFYVLFGTIQETRKSEHCDARCRFPPVLIPAAPKERALMLRS